MQTDARKDKLTGGNAAVWIAFGVFLFCLLTDALPLAQLGVIAYPIKKTRAILPARISLLVFATLLAAIYFWKKPLFNRLALTKAIAQLSENYFLKTAFGLSLLYAFLSSAVCFARQAALETRAFDLGIFAQAVWNTLRGDFLYSSLKEGICLLGDHFSPILLFVTPAYWLWSDPRMILIVQACATASCVFLIAIIAKGRLQNRFLALIFTTAFFFYMPARKVLLEDFHPEVLSEPFILLAFLFATKKKRVPFLLSVFVLALGKENMLGVSFIFGAYVWLANQWKRTGLAVMIVSVAAFLLETRWLIPQLSGQPYFYASFFKQFLQSPSASINMEHVQDSTRYLVRVLALVAFLPLFHLSTFMLTFPILFQNLLSNSTFFRSFGYHYSVGLTPPLFIASIYGFYALTQRFPSFAKRKKRWALIFLFVTILQSPPSTYYSFVASARNVTAEKNEIRKVLSQIPSDASVLSHNNLIPQMVNRKHIFMFAYSDEPRSDQALKRNVDYVVLYGGTWESGSESLANSMIGLAAAGYQIVKQKNDFIILKKTT